MPYRTRPVRRITPWRCFGAAWWSGISSAAMPFPGHRWGTPLRSDARTVGSVFTWCCRPEAAIQAAAAVIRLNSGWCRIARDTKRRSAPFIIIPAAGPCYHPPRTARHASGTSAETVGLAPKWLSSSVKLKVPPSPLRHLRAAAGIDVSLRFWSAAVPLVIWRGRRFTPSHRDERVVPTCPSGECRRKSDRCPPRASRHCRLPRLGPPNPNSRL
mmetsp:Transcript_15116/g.32929  ORF Transcript_15116/g.32929 Transcript_15116/m.32929 type:complete len:214 (-) Transcript_15116:662-1303(-)